MSPADFISDFMLTSKLVENFQKNPIINIMSNRINEAITRNIHIK